MTTDAVPTHFAMLGDPAAEACEGDACLIPVTQQPSGISTIQE